MTRLVALALVAFAACGTARPQAPDPTEPERGVVPAGPPAPDARKTQPDLAPAGRKAQPDLAPPTPARGPAPLPGDELAHEHELTPALTPEHELAPAPAPATTPEHELAHEQEHEHEAPALTPEPALTPALTPTLTPDLALGYVQTTCTEGPISRCAEAIAATRDLALPPEARAQITLEEARIAVWSAVDAQAVGVLLPLSGPYAKLGAAAKEALDLAFAARSLRLVVRDTEGDADKAASLATELVLRERVAVLLGPIGRKESLAAAKVARFFDVPLVPLASEIAAPEGAWAARPDPVLRLRTSPSELAVAVARHARSELGVARVAMLVPDSDVARESASAFAAELERLGGTLVRAVPFDPSTKDFAPALKALLALPDAQKRPGKKQKPDFDALFIPADAPVVRRLVPFLAYWGIHPRTVPGDKGRIQLLGVSGWAHPTVVDKGEHLTDNAVFADVFEPADPDAQDFARLFFLHLQRRPSTFHAEAWDAARLVSETLAAALPASGRLAIRDAFVAPRVLSGVTGTLEVVAGGRLVPRAHLMTVDGDEIRARLSEAEERAMRTQTTPPEAPR